MLLVSFGTWESRHVSMSSRLTDLPTEFQTLSHIEKKKAVMLIFIIPVLVR